MAGRSLSTYRVSLGTTFERPFRALCGVSLPVEDLAGLFGEFARLDVSIHP